MNQKLKITLITLIIILISMVSFVGIYRKNLNAYTNTMKDYLLSRNLKGSRVVELAVAEEEEKETTEGEETTETTTENEEQTEETSVITPENLKTAKKVLENRLKDLGSEDYVIEQNEENGTTTIYLEDNDLVDHIVNYLTAQGTFSVVDSEDESNVLMTNDDLKVAKVGYSQATSGTTVYLTIEFNKDGRKKLEDISNTYITTTDEEGNETEKKIILKMDDTDVLTTSFDETISTGLLQMSIGKASTSSSDLQEYIQQASGMATLLNDGVLPMEYTIEKNEYVSLDNTNQMLQIAAAIACAIFVVISIVLIILYRVNGLKMSVVNIGAVAIFLLLIRYTNVYLAIESMAAVILLFAVMTYISILTLKNRKENTALDSVLQAYKSSWKITVPVLILAVVLSFISWVPVASIGMLLLWGCISIVISSFVFAVPMLSE